MTHRSGDTGAMTQPYQECVRRALAEVLEPTVVDHARADTPLFGAGPGLGLTPGDAIALADAVQWQAQVRGADCVLVDADFAAVTGSAPLTLGGLVDAVVSRWQVAG